MFIVSNYSQSKTMMQWFPTGSYLIHIINFIAVFRYHVISSVIISALFYLNGDFRNSRHLITINYHHYSCLLLPCHRVTQNSLGNDLSLKKIICLFTTQCMKKCWLRMISHFVGTGLLNINSAFVFVVFLLLLFVVIVF